MKKIVLELFQGGTKLGSFKIGDEPITLRIVEENKVHIEMLLRSPIDSAPIFPYGKQDGDDFTMPFPLVQDGEKDVETRPFDLFQGRYIEETQELLEVSEILSSSLMFDDDLIFETHSTSVEDQADQHSYLQADASFELQDEESFDNLPDLPDLPQIADVDIAVWKHQNGEWSCVQKLRPNDEYRFHRIRVWVDERASLLLTGSDNAIISVQHEDGHEEEYEGVNGAITLPPRATVLIQREDEQICFRPE